MRRISVVLVFVVGIGRPIAAQTVTWPFADLGDKLESGRTVHRSGRWKHCLHVGRIARGTGSCRTGLDHLTGRTLIARKADRQDLRAHDERGGNRGTVLARVAGVFDTGGGGTNTRHPRGRRATGLAARREPRQARHVVWVSGWRRYCGHIAALTASRSKSDWSTGDKIFLVLWQEEAPVWSGVALSARLSTSGPSFIWAPPLCPRYAVVGSKSRRCDASGTGPEHAGIQAPFCPRKRHPNLNV